MKILVLFLLFFGLNSANANDAPQENEVVRERPSIRRPLDIEAWGQAGLDNATGMIGVGMTLAVTEHHQVELGLGSSLASVNRGLSYRYLILPRWFATPLVAAGVGNYSAGLVEASGSYWNWSVSAGVHSFWSPLWLLDVALNEASLYKDQESLGSLRRQANWYDVGPTAEILTGWQCNFGGVKDCYPNLHLRMGFKL